MVSASKLGATEPSRRLNIRSAYSIQLLKRSGLKHVTYGSERSFVEVILGRAGQEGGERDVKRET